MIAVRITKRIYIRKGPGRQYASIGDVLPSGKIISMEGCEPGENYKGIGDWYYLTNSNGIRQYYWAGGVESAPLGPINAKGSTQSPFVDFWFKQLGIYHIWHDLNEWGSNATILILDSGISKSITEIYSAVKKTPLIFVTPPDTFECQDSEHHGTHCASLIAARSDTQYIGAAPASDLLVGKITVDGSLDNADTMKAALTEYLKDEYTIDVISISQELYSFDSELQSLISQHVAKNRIVVASIGNDYSYSNKPFKRYPGCFYDCISVGSCSGDTSLSKFSMNPGGTTIFCYGENILSYQSSTTPGSLSGTSQATAIVAGITALIISFLKSNGISYNSTAIKTLLRKYSSPMKDNADFPLINPSLIFNKLQKFIQNESKDLQHAIDADTTVL